MTSKNEKNLADYNDLSDFEHGDDGDDGDTLPSFLIERVWGERLDKVLANLMPDVSRARLQKLIEEGQVEVNGEVVTKIRQKVSDGDEVQLLEEPHIDEMLGAEPQDVPLEVVYEDDAIIVINKAPDQVVHPGAGNGGYRRSSCLESGTGGRGLLLCRYHLGRCLLPHGEWQRAEEPAGDQL